MRPLQEAEQLPIDANIEDLEEITDLEINELELEEENTKKKESKRLKAHIIRRNIEDYLEQKALERRLSDVFDFD
ncbi:MAG: hypothetical protein DSZ29_07865 [Aquificaceae bacterium]|nr:MAG: hypothetical protein DSZ29_07865 [Aquificaceae bacterium]